MQDLSPEDKYRIYLEEKERLELEKQPDQEKRVSPLEKPGTAPKPKPHDIKTVVGYVLFVFGILSFLGCLRFIFRGSLTGVNFAALFLGLCITFIGARIIWGERFLENMFKKNRKHESENKDEHKKKTKNPTDVSKAILLVSFIFIGLIILVMLVAMFFEA